jgi:predicted short-subunit dehydrogenase-like oxidoreductase (DUF2520 family)
MRKARFITVGLGPVGRSLTIALKKAGYKPVLLVGRGKTTERSLAKKLGTRLVSSLPEDIENVDFILLTVQTSLVAWYARDIAGRSLPWKKLTFIHTAGSLGIEPLLPLAARGAEVAAMHPYQTFPKGRSGVNLRGVYYGITGKGKGGALAKRVARDLGGHPFVFREEDRMLYHLSAILACTFVAADIEMATEVLKFLGWPEQRALAATSLIAEETIRNLKELGFRAAMTGPQTRGDRRLIRRHLKELHGRLPEFESMYRIVSEAIMQESGALTKKKSNLG